jgi:arylsulfatase A-like enzyme
MKIDQWEGGHRVPFIAQWPGRIPAGKVRSDLFCLTDMLATVAGVVGHSLPDQMAPDSYNLLPVLLNQRLAQPIRRELLIENRAYRQDNWKYIQGSGAGGLSTRYGNTRYGNVPASTSSSPGELYNLQTDPSERVNLISSEPERVQAMAEKVRVHSAKTRPETRATEPG